MCRLVYISIILFVSGCQIFENENQTRKVIEEFSSKKNCSMTYDTSIEYDKSEIKLYHACDLPDDWEKGMFMYTLYQEFESIGVHYDRISLISEEPGDSSYTRRSLTLAKVEKKMNQFLVHLQYFNQFDLKKVYASFSPKLKKELSYVAFKLDFGQIENPVPFKLVGFKLSYYQNQRRAYFCAKNDRNTLILSYELKPYKTAIESIQIF